MTKHSRKRWIDSPRQRFYPLTEPIHQSKARVTRLSPRQWRQANER
jgi:hypothetical protein